MPVIALIRFAGLMVKPATGPWKPLLKHTNVVLVEVTLVDVLVIEVVVLDTVVVVVLETVVVLRVAVVVEDVNVVVVDVRLVVVLDTVVVVDEMVVVVDVVQESHVTGHLNRRLSISEQNCLRPAQPGSSSARLQ